MQQQGQLAAALALQGVLHGQLQQVDQARHCLEQLQAWPDEGLDAETLADLAAFTCFCFKPILL